MNNEIAERPSVSLDLQEKVLLGGDLSNLTPAERLSYYNNVCLSLDLNPLTRPFEYIVLNNKMVLYARKDATEQLRTNRKISVTIVEREVIEGVYVVTARATDPAGRFDESIGAVPIEKLIGNDRANAMMKAETKAKRRVTLSICGLGMLDETEVETIKDAKPVLEIPQVRPRNDATMVQPPAGTTIMRHETDEDFYPLPKRQEDGAGDVGSSDVHGSQPTLRVESQKNSDAPAASHAWEEKIETKPAKSGADMARAIADTMEDQYEDGLIGNLQPYQGTKAYQKGVRPGYFDLEDGQGGLVRKFKYMDPALDVSSGLKRVYYRTEHYKGQVSYAVTKIEALE